MTLRVQKYGGTSVSTTNNIEKIAGKIAEDYSKGDDFVIVVSAMGDTTDKLINLAKQISDNPDLREMDKILSTGENISSSLLAMCFHNLGIEALSLTGAQAGISTDSFFSKAAISDIDPARIILEIEQRKIVVVAGFQGINDEKELTTLGRGGSDTTAVAIAASMGADICEIYTDVEGVYEADPRLIPNVSRIDRISYEEMLELSSEGAQVIHSRAVELAMVNKTPIFVGSTFSENKLGTLIQGSIDMENHSKVRGITHDRNVARITVSGVPDVPGIAAKIFAPLADSGISVDIIVQNTGFQGQSDMSFTVSEDSLDNALVHTEAIATELGARNVTGDASLAKVSIVGAGLQNSPGYAGTMFKALDSAGVNIEMITTAEISITCVIKQESVEAALNALNEAFLVNNTS